jgi:hypothetical protein
MDYAARGKVRKLICRFGKACLCFLFMSLNFFYYFIKYCLIPLSSIDDSTPGNYSNGRTYNH